MLKTKHVFAGLAILGCLGMAGCSSGEKSDSGLRAAAAQGPVFIGAKSNPDTLKVNRYLQAEKPHSFIVDIQDFAAPVTDVKLKLMGTPFEISLEKIGGNTWRGQLTPEQLSKLAVNGRSVKYEAQAVARDQNGAVATSQSLLSFHIEAPSADVSG